MDIPSGMVVLIGMKGCVVGNSNVICVSGSWGSLCFFVSCESSLDSCCWSSSFRLFVRSCSSTGSFSACGSKVVISSMNGVGDWGGGSSLVADSSGVLSNFRFLLPLGHYVDLDNFFFLELVDLVEGSGWELW